MIRSRLECIAKICLDEVLDSCCGNDYTPSCKEKLDMLGITIEEAIELGLDSYFEED